MGLGKIYTDLRNAKRALPDFIIIGAQKSGTTSLYDYLVQHPLVESATEKEIRFFHRANLYHKGLNWYRGHFPLQSYKEKKWENCSPITGEATPEYLLFPRVPQRVREALPNVKLIAILRNPVDRAFSQYQVRVKRGHEDLTFEEAIKREPERLDGELQKMLDDETYFSRPYLLYSYLRRGYYAQHLEQWLKFYPREQLLILRAEDMFEDPNRVYQEVLQFLEIPTWKLEVPQASNTGSYSTSLKPEPREMLQQHFSLHNQQLEVLTQRNFGWDESEKPGF